MILLRTVRLLQLCAIRLFVSVDSRMDTYVCIEIYIYILDVGDKFDVQRIMDSYDIING